MISSAIKGLDPSLTQVNYPASKRVIFNTYLLCHFPADDASVKNAVLDDYSAREKYSDLVLHLRSIFHAHQSDVLKNFKDLKPHQKGNSEL